MTTQWRQVFTSVVLASLLLAISSPVLSFGTINKLGQHAEHEHITRAALACRKDESSGDCFEPLSIDQLAGSPGHFGAVGAPDAMPFHEGYRAHCDNADFFDSATYTPSQPCPVSREAATATLGECVTHLQTRFGEGITEAEGLLNSEDRIGKDGVDLVTKGRCKFAPSFKGRAKCNVFDGIGRMLHGIQDFYSHSNWADSAPPPFTYKNPPGLGRSAPACLLSMRRAPWGTFDVPYNLSTGCYDAVAPDTGADNPTPVCLGRVTHDTLNKDKGSINVVDGSTSSPKDDRGEYGTNFRDAVRAAIDETQRQWRDFRAELERKYGARRSSLMICALTRDDPLTSCQGRKMAIVIDSSGSNGDTDPSNLRIAAAKAFNAMLITKATSGPDGLPDRVTVVDFDSSARVIYPLGDPSAATFLGIDSSGGTYIAGGVATAIEELTKDRNDPTADRTGIILLTDGEDSDIPGLVAQINRAGSLGIRVAYGVLSPSAQNVSPVNPRELHRREPPAELVTAILKTGGMFSKIYSAETQKSFIDLVVTHGPTNLDNAKGSNDGVPLTPGLEVSGLVSASAGTDIFTYHGFPGDKLNITIRSMKNQPLKAVLFDIRANILVVKSTTDAKGKAIITFSVFNETDFDLIISTDANEVVYSVSLEKTPGSTTEFSSRVSSSTYSTSSNSPGPELSLSTALSRSTPLSPSTLSRSTLLSPPIYQTAPSPPSSASLTSSTAAVLQLTTSQQMTVCTTFWTTITADRPSSTIVHHRRKLAVSPHFDGTLAMAASLSADSKETESSTGVFALLISVIGVQSALILGSLIWWSCFAKGQLGTILQSDGRMRFILEWIVPWASRHGYSKPGDGNALFETEKKYTL